MTEHARLRFISILIGYRTEIIGNRGVLVMTQKPKDGFRLHLYASGQLKGHTFEFGAGSPSYHPGKVRGRVDWLAVTTRKDQLKLVEMAISRVPFPQVIPNVGGKAKGSSEWVKIFEGGAPGLGKRA